MVQDLLEGFVHEDWVQLCDFTTLEKQNNSFVSKSWQRRESDVIWRLRLKDQWLYVYILLEFQSSPDPFMALRMLGYTSLFLQDVVKQQQLKQGDKLPPVLPLVIYNGEADWRSPVSFSELLQDMPLSLAAHQPKLDYVLIDENRCSDQELKLYNLVTYLVKMEKSDDELELVDLVGTLIGCLSTKSDTPDLGHDFAHWIIRSLLPAKMPGTDMPQVEQLQEVKNMLAERVTQWKDRWRREGLQEGIEQGIEQGARQKQYDIAKRLHADGFELDKIMLITDLPLNELQTLLADKD